MRRFNYGHASCELEHSYCHTCGKEVCEAGEADVHRSIGHDVQLGLPGSSRSAPRLLHARIDAGRARVA